MDLARVAPVLVRLGEALTGVPGDVLSITVSATTVEVEPGGGCFHGVAAYVQGYDLASAHVLADLFGLRRHAVRRLDREGPWLHEWSGRAPAVPGEVLVRVVAVLPTGTAPDTTPTTATPVPVAAACA